ncbi:MAG: FadR/GntR family transcriptional regulator [Blautia massiliensis (ex Durand et al. 2017)]
MEQEKTAHKLLGAQVEDALMTYILETPVPVGEKLPNEFELGQMFQAGRSTIREAVKTLATKGILEVRRGDGTYVKSHRTLAEDPLGLSRLEDQYKLALELLDVRLILEPEIAASAAANATPQDKAELKALCDEVERICLAGGDHIPKDIAFHTCIARCSRNRVMEMLIPIINTAVMTFASLTHRTLRRETVQTHRAITDAILEGDAVGARCAMSMHLTCNRQAIRELWKEHQKQQSGAPE